MIPFFTKLNQQHKSLAFEKFLISILKQQALENHKDIMFDVNFDDLYGKPSKSNGLYLFDAYAPNGFDSDIPSKLRTILLLEKHDLNRAFLDIK